MSQKLQLIKELFNLAKELIYAPPPAQESPEEKKVKTATQALKDVADIALKIQQAEATAAASAHAIEVLEEEIKKQRAYTLIAIIAAVIAILIALLFK
jgi:predicted nucleic acid-binding Zn ribbon protein